MTSHIANDTNDLPNTTAQNPSRRDFLGLSWRIMGAVAVGQGAYLGLRFLASRQATASQGKIVMAGLVDNFPPGTVAPFEAAQFFLVRFADGGFLALHTKCTHLACAVAWDNAHRRFNCPCHGSEFSQDGAVLNTPAPRPLNRFLITLEDDKVLVKTGKPITRHKISSDDLVYAPLPPPDQPDAPSGPAGLHITEQ